MTDQLSERKEISVQSEKFEDEKKLQRMIAVVFEEAELLQVEVFAAREDALAALQSFNANSIERVAEVERVQGTALTLQGEGVTVPNLVIKAESGDESEANITIKFNNEQTYRPLNPFEKIRGFMESFSGSVIQHGSGSGYGLSLFFIAKMAEIQTSSIRLGESDIKAIELNVLSRSIVRLSEDSLVTVEELERYDEKRSLIDELSKFGMYNTLFRRQLINLERALHGENDEEYAELKKVEFIHRIAELGEMHARKGYQQADLVCRAIMDTIGRDRLIKVAFNQPLSGDNSQETIVKGHPIGVLMPESEDDMQVPTIVIEDPFPLHDEEPIKHIEFARIQGLSF